MNAMPYNKKILGRARSRLADLHQANVDEHARRLRTVYFRIPEVEQIDLRLRSQMIELARLSFSHAAGTSEQMEKLKEENLSLQIRRAELLVANGFPRDWLDDIFSCPHCKDTGNLGPELCSCLLKLYNQELTKELSSLLRNGDESFEHFDLSLYSNEYNSYFGCVPREYMASASAFCQEYANSFPAVSSSLLLRGDPGLGKTYLSACIARVVAERGYSVYYDTAVSAFSVFEKQQFSGKFSAEEVELASTAVRHMLECDLLILDDLGTEVVTPVVTSALYTLINTRLNNGKFMLINTTLYPDDIASRYTPSIRSRLEGYFKIVNFAGSDIRLLLRRRSN